MKAINIVVILAAAWSSGCDPVEVRGVSTSGTSWTVESDMPIPGIHYGAVEVIGLGKETPTSSSVVIWCAGAIGASAHARAGSVNTFCDGLFSFTDDKRVSFACDTTDGKSVAVKIGDQRFNTKSGSLFIIAGPPDKPVVKQLAIDVKSFPIRGELIKEFAMEHPEIAGFFEQQSGSASNIERNCE